MALSLMSSLQILAHQSPTVRKFWEIKRIHTVLFTKSLNYFWKARIPLKGIYGSEMRLIDAHNPLRRCLGLSVAGEYIALCYVIIIVN